MKLSNAAVLRLVLSTTVELSEDEASSEEVTLRFPFSKGLGAEVHRQLGSAHNSIHQAPYGNLRKTLEQCGADGAFLLDLDHVFRDPAPAAVPFPKLDACNAYALRRLVLELLRRRASTHYLLIRRCRRERVFRTYMDTKDALVDLIARTLYKRPKLTATGVHFSPYLEFSFRNGQRSDHADVQIFLKDLARIMTPLGEATDAEATAPVLAADSCQSLAVHASIRTCARDLRGAKDAIRRLSDEVALKQSWIKVRKSQAAAVERKQAALAALEEERTRLSAGTVPADDVASYLSGHLADAAIWATQVNTVVGGKRKAAAIVVV